MSQAEASGQFQKTWCAAGLALRPGASSSPPPPPENTKSISQGKLHSTPAKTLKGPCFRHTHKESYLQKAGSSGDHLPKLLDWPWARSRDVHFGWHPKCLCPRPNSSTTLSTVCFANIPPAILESDQKALLRLSLSPSTRLHSQCPVPTRSSPRVAGFGDLEIWSSEWLVLAQHALDDPVQVTVHLPVQHLRPIAEGRGEHSCGMQPVAVGTQIWNSMQQKHPHCRSLARQREDGYRAGQVLQSKLFCASSLCLSFFCASSLNKFAVRVAPCKFLCARSSARGQENSSPPPIQRPGVHTGFLHLDLPDARRGPHRPS